MPCHTFRVVHNLMYLPLGHHYDMPATHTHVIVQVVMFLGIVLNVISHVSRTATDFFLKSLTLVVQLAFQATATSTATANALHEDVLAQIPTTLDAALTRFNLSTHTITYTVCSACHCVYAPTLCPEFSKPMYPNTCSNQVTPESGTCGASLTEPGSSKPICPYVVHDSNNYVSGLMSQKDNVHHMIAACDDTINTIKREQPSVPPSRRSSSGPSCSRMGHDSLIERAKYVCSSRSMSTHSMLKACPSRVQARPVASSLLHVSIFLQRFGIRWRTCIWVQSFPALTSLT